MADPFDTAELYTCRDGEELSLETPEEAIEEWADDLGDGDRPGSLSDLIAAHGPLKVEAYNRRVISPAWLRSLAIDLADRVYDELTQEYGDPDGEIASLSPAAEDDLRRTFEADLVRVFRDRGVKPWQCERVAAREYSPAEVEAVLRGQCPEWFEDQVAAHDDDRELPGG